jgi:hypothetical protein
MKGSISLYKLHIMWGVFMIGIFNSKSKIIKAELDPVLEKLGYPKLKRGDVDKGRIWISEKNTGGLTQKITIQEVYNILNIDLRTNVYAAKMIRVDEKEGILRFTEKEGNGVSYKNINEFKNVIFRFKLRMEKDLVNELEKLSMKQGLGSTLTDVKNSVRNYVNVYDTYEMETDKGICFKLEDIDDWGSYICI